ncbi:acetate--CoA ligase family protein [Nocardiopsis potens]|uniref:acetate--CoA ligase family protein n=1 Tax=Nocardiopsis potens TaxID=1246458 RepID=UPI00034AAB18|nr:acetate--CoA ligase family protein [Nocardiopsis potens]
MTSAPTGTGRGPVPQAVPEHRAKALAARAGVPVPRGAVAGSAAGAARAAAGLRPPLVLKAHGPGLLHKSDAGAVRLGLAGPDEVAAAAEEMGRSLAGAGYAAAGFLVEEQAEAGVELIVGVLADPAFGPVLMVGLGGVWTEVLDDAAVLPCPVRRGEVESMLAGLRGAALLDGARGAAPVHRPALLDLVMAVGGPGGLAERLGPRLAEFELNPVIAGPHGAVAVDARLLLRDGDGDPDALPAPREDGTAEAGNGAPPAPQRHGDGEPGAPRTPREGGTTGNGDGAPPAPQGHGDGPGAPPASRRDGGARGGAGGPSGAADTGADTGTDFTRLFAPRGIAVVGASASRPSFGNMLLGQYRAAGFSGTLVAVHPEAAEVDGVPAVPSLRDVPPEVDYALVAVPARGCAQAVRDAAGTGIGFVQVVSGGFAESGPEGAALEDELRTAARRSGVRLLGPNCMGVYSPAGGQTFLGGAPGRPGRISLVSQSGGLAGEVVRVGERRGLRFAKAATLGNSADVTPAELVRFLAADPGTGVLGLYLEDPRDGRALAEALQACAGRLPAVALIGGRTAQGGRAAASHTGGMVRDARIWTGLAERCGLALVDGQDALIGALDFLELHAHRRAGGGPGVLVVGPSGGASVLAADVFDAAGARLEPLPGAARAALRSLGLGAGAPLGNPLEIPLGPRGRKDLARPAAAAVAAESPDGSLPDIVAHANVQSFATFAAPGADGGAVRDGLLEYVSHLAALQEELPASRVTLVLRNPECGPPDLLDALRPAARRAGIPCYTSMEGASAAIAAGKAFARARAAAER